MCRRMLLDRHRVHFAFPQQTLNIPVANMRGQLAKQLVALRAGPNPNAPKLDVPFS